MNTASLTAAAILAVILAAALRSIYRQRKHRGTGCTGCPYSGSCGSESRRKDKCRRE